MGPGWAQRNETSDLARAFDGRVYSEVTMADLASWLQAEASGNSAGPSAGGSHQGAAVLPLAAFNAAPDLFDTDDDEDNEA